MTKGAWSQAKRALCFVLLCYSLGLTSWRSQDVGCQLWASSSLLLLPTAGTASKFCIYSQVLAWSQAEGGWGLSKTISWYPDAWCLVLIEGKVSSSSSPGATSRLSPAPVSWLNHSIIKNCLPQGGLWLRGFAALKSDHFRVGWLDEKLLTKTLITVTDGIMSEKENKPFSVVWLGGGVENPFHVPFPSGPGVQNNSSGPKWWKLTSHLVHAYMVKD